MDESGLPVENVQVSIDGGEYLFSDLEGEFTLVLKKELVMPFDVTILKSGYTMKEFSFDESSNKMEIVLNTIKASKQENIVLKDKENVLKGVESDAGLTSDAREAKQRNIPADTIAQVQLNEKVFKQYQGDFDELTNEIIAERIRVEGNNKKITEEISAITNRLEHEKNLSKEQRNELQKYLGKLESTLLENTIAFQKSQERTNFLIQKLKTIIMEKDSIHSKALQKIAVVEKESRKIERKFKRNIIVFSIITAALLLLAIVFYSIAIKMKKQRKELMKANEEMHGIKDQLAKSIVELKDQNKLLEEQKRQLNSLQ